MDRESAYEMLQKGVQASAEQQNNPAVKGKEVAVDDGILGGLKDILFGTTGPRGGKKDGVVQTMAKSAARQVTNQIVRGMLGSLLGGRRRKGAFAPFIRSFGYDFLINSHRLIKKKLALGNSAPMIGGMP